MQQARVLYIPNKITLIDTCACHRMIKLHESIKACSLEVSEMKTERSRGNKIEVERNDCLHTNYTMELISLDRKLNQSIDRSRNSCSDDGWVSNSRVAATYTQH